MQENKRLIQMKIGNGKKLGSGSLDNSQKNSIAFDNQFLQNEEEDIEKYNQNQSEMSGNIKMTRSQFLPIQTKQNQLKKKSKQKQSQAKRLKKLNNGMDKLSVSILQMKQKYSDLDMEEILFKKRSQKKQKQIKEFLTQIKTQKIKRIKKNKRIMERQAKIYQQSINLQQQQKKNKQIQNLNKLKQLKMQKQKEKKQINQKNKAVQQMYSKIHEQQKNKPKFHVRKLQQQKKKIMVELEQEKQYLAKRKQIYKPLDKNQLQEHQKMHGQLLQQLETIKKSQKQQQYLKILEKNKKLQQFYRGRAYDLVIEQQQQRKVKKEQPLQKYKKMKNYQDYIRENFIPKTQHKQKQNNQQTRENHSSFSHREVKRYRFLHGVSYGEIIQNKPVPKTQAEQKKLGNQYLAYMYSIPKRKEDRSKSYDFSQDNIAQVKIKQKKPNPLANRSGRKSLQIKVSQKPTRDELDMVIDQLKQKDKQLNMKQKVLKHTSGAGSPHVNRKQLGEDLIFNIEKKLSLLGKM